MNEILPWLFLFFAALCLITAAFTFFHALRGVLQKENNSLNPNFQSHHFDQLKERKNLILRNLKELKTDHEEGKISDEDFHALENSMRNEAKIIFQQIDAQIEPSRNQAQALISQTLEDFSSDSASKQNDGVSP